MATTLTDTALCVMAKAPRPGAVKTRLSPPLSKEDAATLAAAFLLDTWASAEAACDLVLLARAGRAADFPAPLDRAEGFEQAGGDLGARIEAVARDGLRRSGKVVVVGSDLPGLPPANLVAIGRALDTRDVVIGPSGDGGFYAIGFRACPVGCLAGIPWSHTSTRAQTRSALSAAGLEVVESVSYDDIDDIEGLLRLRGALEAGTVQAPATAEVLRTISWDSPSSYPP